MAATILWDSKGSKHRLHRGGARARNGILLLIHFGYNFQGFLLEDIESQLTVFCLSMTIIRVLLETLLFSISQLILSLIGIAVIRGKDLVIQPVPRLLALAPDVFSMPHISGALYGAALLHTNMLPFLTAPRLGPRRVCWHLAHGANGRPIPSSRPVFLA